MGLSEFQEHPSQTFKLFPCGVLSLRDESFSPQRSFLQVKKIPCLLYAWLSVLKRSINNQVELHAGTRTRGPELYKVDLNPPITPSPRFASRLHIERVMDFLWTMRVYTSIPSPLSTAARAHTHTRHHTRMQCIHEHNCSIAHHFTGNLPAQPCLIHFPSNAIHHKHLIGVWQHSCGKS